MKIQDLMSQSIATCRSGDHLDKAAQLMWEHDCGSIPVVNEYDRLVGIITDRDICMATYTQGSPPHAIPVSDTMAKEVFSCHAGESLDVAERLMSEKQIRRLPVVDNNDHPIGVLSLNDIARYAASSRKKNGLDREVTQTLAAICQPRPQVSHESIATQPQS